MAKRAASVVSAGGAPKHKSTPSLITKSASTPLAVGDSEIEQGFSFCSSLKFSTCSFMFYDL